ncbi:MAG: HetZ-related protein 2 [Prochloraceae cyanobacterium]
MFMQTVKQVLKNSNYQMKVAVELEECWRSRLSQDYSKTKQKDRESIINWLLGEDRSRLEQLTPEELAIVKQAMDYRYRILAKRYLGVSPTQAYRHLIDRLASPIVLRQKLRSWIEMSRERQRSIAEVLQEVIQEMLNSDRYIQGQIAWIAQCTQSLALRNDLLLASIEEYSLRPIRNQPLLLYRLINFMRRQARGGMTQVPKDKNLRLISEEVIADERDLPLSLLDNKAVCEYKASQNWQEQQALRIKVQQEFELYLAENVSPLAVKWLKLYLQGHSPDEIANILNLPIKKIYRLREKVSYHALRVFTVKKQPELVAQWLEISLQEHNLGLTPKQWKIYWQSLTPIQRQLITNLKAGEPPQDICQKLNWKMNQIVGEWTTIYSAAQELRTATISYN